MVITDTHCHLYSEAFEDDRDAMMQRAIEAGVKRFFVPAIDSNYAEAMFKLEASYSAYVHLMMGLHPTSVKPESYKQELQLVEQYFKERPFKAVGEIGIDLYWDKSTLQIQQDAFKFQIDLARQYELPIVIHCRDSFDEIFEVLEDVNHDKLFGIFHCFTGTKAQAERALSFNMKLGIGGVVTFKNGKIDQFLNEIDLKHIVLETDAPYLSPTPFRGKRNESSYIIMVLNKLSEIYKLPIEQIAEITTANSKEVFKI